MLDIHDGMDSTIHRIEIIANQKLEQTTKLGLMRF
jgi:hypothetical protein